ncbi:prepilin-type N-terminal cleavage/methylation domain-containing protein [Fredinandcohnia onubensis]|uniref:prepilin-type N-terminal cleavage/methylation domain-containing protein n=1 Tax=Fredinandcohnia onubensis TaxID=1571209 RepID=UPI000C0BD67D|nr:type II secretion system protein [Fredinandcohnia onubensis]
MYREFLKQNKGITLIELLASLAILTIFIALLSGVLINSMNYFDLNKKKISLSQEANQILANITNIHQDTAEYTLTAINSGTGNKQIKVNETVISHPDLDIEILNAGQTDYQVFHSSLVVETSNPLFIEIKITDTENTQNSFTLRTVINRY